MELSTGSFQFVNLDDVADVNGAGLLEALVYEARSHTDLVCGSIALLFGLGRRDVGDGLQQPATVEPVDPIEGRVFDCFERSPRYHDGWMTSAL